VTRWWRPTHPAGAALSYVLVTAAFTWPLVTGLTHLVPWDLGDPLLNDWILAWHYHQAGRLLSGDLSALATWWHPPIFHPAPYALGYSELLVTQALLGAPVHGLTGNLLLTYNVLFLASFVLSALGAFLLVRQLTGDARAAWLAGLLYGFALYRVGQGPHIQVLHAQWAPFALWFVHRWLDHGRWRDALLGGVALAAQNLSNGYYLFYLALLLPPWVLWQLWTRGRLFDRRAWNGIVVVAALGTALTVPFMYPYLQLRADGQATRPLAAVAYYGADTFAWVTANDQLRLWGWMRTLPRPEGDLFPGAVPLMLALVALLTTLHTRVREAGDARRLPDSRDWKTRLRRGVAVLAATVVALHTLAIGVALFAGVTRLPVGPTVVSFANGRRLLVVWAAAVVLLLCASRRARRAVADTPQAPVVLLAALVALTVWLSFGPVIRVGGRPSGSWPEIYSLLYDGIPGASALRVPPRVAMMTALLLAVLGGIGAAALRRAGRLPAGAVALLGAVFLAEAWPAPIPVNLPIDAGTLAAPPVTVPGVPGAHDDARLLAGLPATAVLVELPIGSLPWETRWQYLQAGHWRARVNGYSGGFPDAHLTVEQVLGSLPDRAVEAAALLHEHGVTHVVLHPEAWRDADTPEAVRRWLRALGGEPLPPTSTSAMEVWALP
jgi:hypothetical protein